MTTATPAAQHPHEPMPDVAPHPYTAVGPDGAVRRVQLACLWCKQWYPQPAEGETAGECPWHAQAAATAAQQAQDAPAEPLGIAGIGVEIERLGRAVEAHTMRLPDAVTALLRVDSSLSVRGAELQLASWRSARSRYADAAERTARALAEPRVGPTAAEVRRRAPFVIAARQADRPGSRAS